MKNRRYRYWISPGFQVPFTKNTVMATALTAIVATAVGFAVGSTAAIQAAGVGSLSMAIQWLLRPQATLYLVACVVSAVTLGITVVWFSILSSHKIAGPLYRINTNLKMLTNGEEWKPIVIRKSDWLHEVVGQINESVGLLIQRNKGLQERVDELTESKTSDGANDSCNIAQEEVAGRV